MPLSMYFSIYFLIRYLSISLLLKHTYSGNKLEWDKQSFILVSKNKSIADSLDFVFPTIWKTIMSPQLFQYLFNFSNVSSKLILLESELINALSEEDPFGHFCLKFMNWKYPLQSIVVKDFFSLSSYEVLLDFLLH